MISQSPGFMWSTHMKSAIWFKPGANFSRSSIAPTATLTVKATVIELRSPSTNDGHTAVTHSRNLSHPRARSLYLFSTISQPGDHCDPPASFAAPRSPAIQVSLPQRDPIGSSGPTVDTTTLILPPRVDLVVRKRKRPIPNATNSDNEEKESSQIVQSQIQQLANPTTSTTPTILPTLPESERDIQMFGTTRNSNLRVETPPTMAMMMSMRTSPGVARGGSGGSGGRAGAHSSLDAASSSMPPSATTARVVATLRQRIRSCIERHHITSALFFADKLATLSPSEPLDILLFAETCFLHREYHRAIHSIRCAGLLDFGSPYAIAVTTLQAYLLVGQSMLAIKQKEDGLDLLTKVIPDDEVSILALARRYSGHSKDCGGINIVASLALLMGETFEGVGNRENALIYYRIALRCDVRCAEAFFHLVEKQMLSSLEQAQLLESLDFGTGQEDEKEEMEMLKQLYGVHVGKYDSTPSTETKFAMVEDRFGLQGNIELNIAKAETYYYHHDIQKAHEICEWVRERDPYNFKVVPVYVATVVELGKKRELYQYAHHLVDVYPKKASSWYTVGCYYLVIQKFDAAQRYFHKATTLEPSFAPAWIGFGNSFAAQDESDQAMSSYRTASSLFPGCHLPTLYIGMEHLRTNNLPQALEFIKQASVICPNDPLIYNELGSVYYKQRNYPMAVEMFTKTLDLCKHLPERLMETWEATLFNLGYSYRKLRKYDDAIRCFQSALRLSPRNASIHAALGFTHHMKGNLEDAIECYHADSSNTVVGLQALAYNSEESLAGEMITIAFEESLSASRAIPLPPPPPPPSSSILNTPHVTHRTTNNRTRTSSSDPWAATAEDNVRRTLRLDHSFSSFDHHDDDEAGGPDGSSLEFSDDSSMNIDIDE